MTEGPSGIWVTGIGEARAAADVAYLGLGVAVMRRSVGAAREAAAETMGRVLEALRRGGVADKDISTTRFRLEEEYDHSRDSGRRFLGYQVSHGLRATVRGVEGLERRASVALDAALAAGSEQVRVNYVSFARHDIAALRREARELAVADARNAAEHFAALTGSRLGPVRFVAEGTLGEGELSVGKSRYLMMDAAPPAPTPLAAGEEVLTVTVTVNYAIEDQAGG